jgi:phage replication initiation protein
VTARLAAALRSAGGAAQRRCPPVLTGGESPGEAGQGAKVDWLTVTWQPESGDLHIAREVWQAFESVFGYAVVGQESAGRYGYAFGCVYSVIRFGSVVPVGRVDWGGDRHGLRARFDLSGSGCSLVSDWRAVRAWVGNMADARLTRVDLAVDCLMGEFGVEDAVDWYEAGEFHAGGRRPRHSLIGDWLDPHYGRTFEVGRRENGKMLRAYEKGRQLGDCVSPWVRWEVELRNVDRDLPLDLLVESDRYFVGAYEALRAVLPAAGERIRTHQAEGEISLGRLVQSQRVAYGQVVSVLRAKLTAGQVLDVLSRPGLPRRLQRSSLDAFHLIGADALLCHEGASP